MSFLNLENILKRLRSGISPLSTGEQRAVLNYLVDRINELEQQIESLRRSESSPSSKDQDTGNRVRRGRKPKQDSGKISSTPRDA